RNQAEALCREGAESLDAVGVEPQRPERRRRAAYKEIEACVPGHLRIQNVAAPLHVGRIALYELHRAWSVREAPRDALRVLGALPVRREDGTALHCERTNHFGAKAATPADHDGDRALAGVRGAALPRLAHRKRRRLASDERPDLRVCPRCSLRRDNRADLNELELRVRPLDSRAERERLAARGLRLEAQVERTEESALSGQFHADQVARPEQHRDLVAAKPRRAEPPAIP